MATTNVKLTADTSQAQQAMTALKTRWVNAAAGMTVVEKAFNVVAGAAEKVNQALREQGQFFSAIKDDAQLAAVQISMAATDGMIKPMAMAKAQNVLMRGDLKLTQEQFNAVAKAAVEMGRATGEDVNNVFDRLTKSILKGSTEAVSEYGITVQATGPIHERQSKILGEIVKRYQSVDVAARDAGEVMEKTANQSQLAMMQNAQKLDSLSQKWSEFKAFLATEWVPGGLDAVLGTSLSKTNQLRDLLWRLRDDATKSDGEIFDAKMRSMDLLDQARKEERADEYRAFQSNINEIDEEIKRKTRLLELAQQLAKGGAPGSIENVRRIEKEITDLSDARVANLAMMEQYAGRHAQQTSKVGALVAQEMQARKEALDAARNQERALLQIDALQKSSNISIMSQFDINERLIDVREKIKNLEPQVTREVQQQAAFLEIGKKAASDMLSLLQSMQPGKIISVFGETDEQRKARLKREADEAERRKQAGKAVAEKARQEQEAAQERANERMNAMMRERDDEQSKQWRKSYQDKIAQEEENTKNRWANFDNENNKLLEKAAAQKERMKALEKKARDEKHEADLAAWEKEQKTREEYVAKTKALIEGLSQVTLNAIFAEKKARDGLSRSDYILKQLAAYMKAEALKYAAKSIGYLAEGVAASMWNPPAAAAAFKASALSAAAAAAFGGGAVAAGAMGGNAKSSSGSASASGGAESQRQAVGGATSGGSTTINIHLGGAGTVLYGDPDELAKRLDEMMRSATKRGRVRA